MNDRNKNRPGYTKTKMGWIPEEWQETFLDNISKRETGHTPDKKKPEYWNGRIKWVSLADSDKLDKPEIHITAKTISEEGLRHSSARLLPSGTVILLRDASVGRVSILAEQMAVSQHFVAWICGNKLFNKFLYYWLNHNKRLFEKIAFGSTILTIGMPFFSQLVVVLPPLPEQKKIAEILSTWDEAIEQIRKLINAKKRRKKALMQLLLTGRRRLPGFCKKWHSYLFKDLFERVTRTNTIGCENVLTISGTLGLVNQKDYFNKQVAAKDLSSYCLIKRGEFAYNKSYCTGYPLGAIKILEKYNEGVLSNLYICFSSRRESAVHRRFMKYYFDGGIFNQELYKIAKEGARNHGLLNVSPREFFATELLLPSKIEQIAIADVISTADSEIKALEQKLAALERQKRGLMQKLLTGEIRVKV